MGKEKLPNGTVHAGHRQRLKQRVRANGLKSFSEHEVLEYLLTYCIPRKDTNELAHKLIDHFNGLSGVLDASIEMLEKVDGVGAETALFLSSFPQMFDAYKISKSTKINYKLITTGDCVKYFREKYEIKSKEHFYCVLLGATCEVIKVFELEGSGDKINLNIKWFADQISDEDVYSLVLMHTHPKGEVYPSEYDIQATQEILNVCCMLHIKLCDHLIFNETTHYSFGINNLIQPMVEQYKRAFGLLSTERVALKQDVKFKYEDKNE